MSAQAPITWDPLSDPHALLGDTGWRDYTVSSDVLLEKPGYAELIGRAGTQSYTGSAGLNAYHLRVSDTGAWSILNSNTNGTVSTLTGGTAAALGTGRWHSLALSFAGSTITAKLDGATLGTTTNSTWATGQVGYATSQGETAQFDNLSVGNGTTTTVSVTNPGSQSGTVGTAITPLQVHASGTTALTYSATGLPAGLSINATSGVISGTPTTSGTSNVTVTATDTTGASASASFTWTIGGTGGSSACRVSYVKNEWSGGFTANLTITNTGTTAINGWSLGWTFPGDQKITNAWNTTATQTGATVTATNAGYNATIAPAGNVQFGFQGTWTTNDTNPGTFTLNGAPCN